MKKQFFLLWFVALFSFTTFGQTVYITKTGEKYHRGNCRYLSHSKIEIQLADAINQGYEACKVCKPPQLTSYQIKEETKIQNTKTVNTESQYCSFILKVIDCKRITTNDNSKY